MTDATPGRECRGLRDRLRDLDAARQARAEGVTLPVLGQVTGTFEHRAIAIGASSAAHRQETIDS